MQFDCEVPGLPQAQGSKRVVNGRMIDASPALRPWRDSVTWGVKQALPQDWPLTWAYEVKLLFRFLRPKGHSKPKGGLTRSAPLHKTTRPDLDKLERAVLDACTDAGAWRDDCQVVRIISEKAYSTEPGVLMRVTAWPDSLLQKERDA